MEQLLNFRKWVFADKTRPLVFLVSAIVALSVLGGLLFSEKRGVTRSEEGTPASVSELASGDLNIVTVGKERVILSGTWPGEVISLNTVSVQPPRDGMILSFGVHIGERVTKGQTLGMLSPPPAMPDSLTMVADASAMSAMARAERDSLAKYSEGRMAQLATLRREIEEARGESTALLSPEASEGMIALRKGNLRGILRGSLIATYPMISGSITLPAKWQDYRLLQSIGAQDSPLRDKFQDIFFSALNDVNDPAKIPDVSGLAYFGNISKLVDASLPDEAMLTSSDLTKLKAMIHKDQSEFIEAVDALRTVELENADRVKMYASDLAMIDNEIAMLKKDIAEAEAKLLSKEIAESAVRNSVLGGTLVIAPQSGIVSAIMRRPGEYVGPGMPLAVITGDGKSGILVRFRVPNNAEKPKQGESVRVNRAGFSEDHRKATIIGIGGSLDDTGSYMADAEFETIPDWPINSSVRVSAGSEANTVSVAPSSVLWDEDKQPFLWGVSSVGRVYKKPITIGRTLGGDVEVYEGLVEGDRYVATPTGDIRENMLIEDIVTPTPASGGDVSSKDPHAGHNMEGMGM